MTFEVVAIKMEVLLEDGPEGDEGLGVWQGDVAGPFDTFEEAEVALDLLEPPDDVVLAIYDPDTLLIYTRAKL